MRAAKRPEREGERGEKSIAERQRQFVRMKRGGNRQRDDRAEGRGDPERQCCPDRKSDRGADRGQQRHLHEIDREHTATGRAERLQRRDDVALAIDMTLHGIGNADAAHQQRGQAHQREILREALDIALERRRGIGTGAGLPAGVRELCIGLRYDGIRRAVAAVGQTQAIVPAHQAARLQQTGGPQRRLTDDHARAKREPGGELVGLGLEHGRDLEGGVADRDSRTGSKLEARQQNGIDHRSERAVAGSKRAGERHAGVELHCAIERIDGIDRLELDQRAAVAGARHRPHGGGDRYLALRAEETQLGGAGFAMDEREGHVAAQDSLALARQSVGQRARERTDARNRHYAERDAGDEDIEAAKAAAQLTDREAEWTGTVSRWDRGGHRASGTRRDNRRCTGV